MAEVFRLIFLEGREVANALRKITVAYDVTSTQLDLSVYWWRPTRNCTWARLHLAPRDAVRMYIAQHISLEVQPHNAAP